jgi:hypothetical protein
VIWNVYGRSGLREAWSLVPSNLKLAACWKLCRNFSTANELNALEQGGASPIRRIFGTFLTNSSNLLRAKFAERSFHVAVADVLEATRVAMASLEINDPRTRKWQIGSHEAIADNGVAARFVVGEQQLSTEGFDLPNTMVVLEKNGEEVALAPGAAVLGDPARAVAWLANKLAECHQSLKAGEIVLPGSITPIHTVSAGDRVEAEFDALGRVSGRFV